MVQLESKKIISSVKDMMLLPKRTKFRKLHRGRFTQRFNQNASIFFGDYGLRGLEPGWITSRQIEATRRSIIRAVRRTGKIWIRIFPDRPITERAAESRMGSGKGSLKYWVAVVQPGDMLFEITGLDKLAAHKVLKTASHKLPIKTSVCSRVDDKTRRVLFESNLRLTKFPLIALNYSVTLIHECEISCLTAQ
jgi:large subunit ribosomal protein L16